MLNSLTNALLIHVALLCVKGHFVYGKSWHTFGPLLPIAGEGNVFCSCLSFYLRGGGGLCLLGSLSTGVLPTRGLPTWGVGVGSAY